MEASYYRLKARENLSGNWLLAALVTLIAMLLGGTGSAASLSFDQEDLEVLQSIPWLWNIIKPMLTWGAITGFIGFVVGGVVNLGYCTFHLHLHDGIPANISDLFSHFKESFARGFLLQLLISLYTVLWTMLFIIPGLVKAYSYAMAPFIMAENPEMSANECITLSRQMMNGHKAELFFLDLSFIGWILLSVFTLGIGNVFLVPYQKAAHAAFYREIS